MFCNHWKMKANREKKKAYILKLELEEEKRDNKNNVLILGRFAEKQMRLYGLMGNTAILKGDGVPNIMTLNTSIAVIKDVINGYKQENKKLKARIKIYERELGKDRKKWG